VLVQAWGDEVGCLRNLTEPAASTKLAVSSTSSGRSPQDSRGSIDRSEFSTSDT
jgi:hypothetical protein